MSDTHTRRYIPQIPKQFRHTSCKIRGTLLSGPIGVRNKPIADHEVIVEGGFFVFGDVSANIAGKARLHFQLYELRP